MHPHNIGQGLRIALKDGSHMQFWADIIVQTFRSDLLLLISKGIPFNSKIHHGISPSMTYVTLILSMKEKAASQS